MRGRAAFGAAAVARRLPARVGTTSTALAATLAIVLAGAAHAHAHGRYPGGAGGGADAAWVRQIQWTTSSPVPGVTLLSGSFTDASSHPYWTDTIQAPTTSPFDGSAEVAEAGSFTWAQQTEATLQADGLQATATLLPWPQYADDPHGDGRPRAGR